MTLNLVGQISWGQRERCVVPRGSNVPKISVKAAVGGSAAQLPAGNSTSTQDIAAMVGLGWREFFDDPSMWRDNRKSKRTPNFPDFVHENTGRGLWVESRFCPEWVQPKLEALQDSSLASTFGAAQSQHKPQRKTVPWTKRITEENKCGRPRDALKVFEEMQEARVRPTAHAYVGALKACGSLRDLETGRKIHAKVLESGVRFHIFVANTLVDMYAKCGSTVEARQVFDMIECPDVVSWTSMILGYAQSEEGDLGLQLYDNMQRENFVPSSRTFVATLKACSALAGKEKGEVIDGTVVKVRCLDKGRAIHSEIAKCGLLSDLFVANCLVDMYSKCGSTLEARRVFDTMVTRDLVSWNSMIMGYAQREEGELALDLFERLPSEGLVPDSRSFIGALKAYAGLAGKERNQVDGKLVKTEYLDKGRAIHSQVVQCGLDSNLFVANSLVDMYAKCGSTVDARRVFDSIACPDLVSWNTMIQGYAHNEEGDVALQLFERMQREGPAQNSRTFLAALKACGSLAGQEVAKVVNGTLIKPLCLENGRLIHSQVIKSGLELDVFVASTLVDMYAKCGSMEDARKVFDKISHRDAVTWNAMIMGYAHGEEPGLALEFYAQMQQTCFTPDSITFLGALKACARLAEQDGKEIDEKAAKLWCLEMGRTIHSQVAIRGLESDIFVASTLVDMYAKCGNMVAAREVFDRIPRHDVVSFTALIVGYAQMEEGELALQLYAQMQQEGVVPDVVAFVGAIMACACLADLTLGKNIHAEICRAGLQGAEVIVTSLIDMYGKCGSMVDAQQLFDTAVQTRDVMAWNVLIAGYSRHGDSKHVFNLFSRMQQEGLQPTAVTFVSILTGCSHAGLVDKGREYFQSMFSDHAIAPTIEHYSCMVDLLGRAGQLDEAIAMVMGMPFKPDRLIWVTILGACRKWNNVELGKHAFQSALTMDERDSAAYVLMANIYGAAGMHDERAKIVEMRMKARAWKKPGQCWWTDSSGIRHTFLAGDTRHPQSKDMYAKIKEIFVKMKDEGYVPDLDCVLHEISDDEKEDVLCGHSERLAIACALINTPPGTNIRIVKNLRVCVDCHQFTSLISKIEQRVITCRDMCRFHVFKDGKCSCGDFW